MGRGQLYPPGHGSWIVADPGRDLANANSLQVLDHHRFMGFQRFRLVGQHKFRPITDRLVALFTVGVEERDFGGMNMIQTQTAWPACIPVWPMSRIVEANWFIGEKTFRIFKIPLDIRAVNCYSHLAVGASGHHLVGIGRGLPNSVTPYAAINDEEAISLIALTRDGFSVFIVKIPAFSSKPIYRLRR